MQGSKECEIDGVSTSTTTKRLLMFSPIDLTGMCELTIRRQLVHHVSTDDDTYLDTPISSELGDIELKLDRVVAHIRKASTFQPLVPHIEQKIHERSKKGSMHCFK